jgi:hypothetical protein
MIIKAGLLTYREAYNMIAQRDSQVMTGLGEASRTMAFLPPTFLSICDPCYFTRFD